MRTSLCILLVAVAVTILVSTDAAPEMTCKQMMADLTKRQLNGIAKCTKSMKFKNGKEKSAKMTCILKCVMSNEGILNPEGLMPLDDFNKFLEKEVPDSMRANAEKVLGACREQHADKLDPSEEFCKSYDPLIKCFMGAVMQLCPT